MSAFTVFISSLGGGRKECEVTPDTSIETLLQEHCAKEDVPEFYEVRLYHASTELRQGTVGDAGLSQGSELGAVVSAPEQHKLMETIIQHREGDTSLNSDGSLSKAVKSCVAALRLLSEYENIERATIDALLEILLDGSDCIVIDTHPIGIAVGEVFGRICNPATEYIPQLIGHIPTPEAILALDEIDNRGEFPHEQKANLMQRWRLAFPVDACKASVLALCRLVARMSDSRLSTFFKEHLDNRLEEPLDEGVYQEAMKILGLDAERDHEEQEDGSEDVPDNSTESDGEEQEVESDGVEDDEAAALAPENLNPASLDGESMPNESDPVQEEQADLQRALLLSKADCPALSGDDVVIFRQLCADPRLSFKGSMMLDAKFDPISLKAFFSYPSLRTSTRNLALICRSIMFWRCAATAKTLPKHCVPCRRPSGPGFVMRTMPW